MDIYILIEFIILLCCIVHIIYVFYTTLKKRKEFKVKRVKEITSLSDLEKSIKKYLNDGWELKEGICLFENGLNIYIYIQLTTKEE